MTESASQVHRYFVDEAGDLSFFDRRRRLIIGQEGVSRCFIVGAALISDPDDVAHRLAALRETLLCDPYFAGVPSLAQSAGKTALLFHAKDDTSEVRREVFRMLRDTEVEVFAAFRRKHVVAEELKAHFARTGHKLGSEFIYEDLVTSIFKDRLHVADETHILFARRGKSDRNIALTKAIDLAKWRFESKWHKGIDRPVIVASSTPSEVAGLQVIDYYLWALQRLLERSESRYFNYLAPAYKLVIDRDDTRQRGYGAYYTSANPLTPEKLMPVT